jgi:outer membrane protein assembly factor BamB
LSRGRRSRDPFTWPDDRQIPVPPPLDEERGGSAFGEFQGGFGGSGYDDLPWEQQQPTGPRHSSGGRDRSGRSGGSGGGWGDDRSELRRLLPLVLGVIVVTIGALAVPRLLPTKADGATTATDNGPVPASGFKTPGLLTFRGNATRTFYGTGPVPQDPKVVWSYPGGSKKLCAHSKVDIGEHQKSSGNDLWCGSGWTGQPSVFDYKGHTWVVFGAYDKQVHFVDWETGEDIIPPFPTGDIIKGSVSIDPDGYPLVYSGSRDNFVHVIAIDGKTPKELWRLPADAVSPVKWNDDWDPSPLIIDDYMFEGGENSQFHIVRLNRGYDANHNVTVKPTLAYHMEGWDDQLTEDLAKLDEHLEVKRKDDVSIENSVAYKDGVIYFANSGGLVQGWDVSGIDQGKAPTRVFRFWNGDDTDASVVIDDQGFLYVASQQERQSPRAEQVGQLIKLDPRKQGDEALVWGVHDPKGFWATPALHGNLVIQPADSGKVYGVDKTTGKVLWTKQLPGPTWSSPVVVDDVWIQGDCAGGIHAFDVANTEVAPPELWNVEVVGCVESTPALWNGRLFVGSRGGRFVAVGD